MPERQITSPLGKLTIVANAAAITRLRWGHGQRDEGPLLTTAETQLKEYFACERREFDLPFVPEASELTREVCAAMLDIPFGETRTYGDLGKALGVPAQAIGQACGANPIPVLIPCHRILAANGLGGYSGAGGIESKVWLLRHEGAAGLLI